MSSQASRSSIERKPGPNASVIDKIAPDIKLGEIVWGTRPFVFPIMPAVVVLRAFPGIATALSDHFVGGSLRK